MSMENQQDIVGKIKKTHENIALTVGTLLAVILVVYFLTYSALANSTYTSLFWFEMLSSPVIAMALYYIRNIAFLLLKIRFMRSPECKQVLDQLQLSDLSE
ncbi:MAG: hypothetical protein Q9M14_07425 [Mariprofundaceae bacterium]|nr:hypothetical protein [Mariprofundaceae bacterium]